MPAAILGWIYLYCFGFFFVLDAFKIVIFNWIDPQGEEMPENDNSTSGGWGALMCCCNCGHHADHDLKAEGPGSTAFLDNYAAAPEPENEEEREHRSTMAIARKRTQKIGEERKAMEKTGSKASIAGSQRSIRRQQVSL